MIPVQLVMLLLVGMMVMLSSHEQAAGRNYHLSALLVRNKENTTTYEVLIQYRECPVGYYLHHVLPGEYYLQDSRDLIEEATEICQKCTMCDDGVKVIRPCSQYSDIVCGRVCRQPGYRFDKATQSCQHAKVLDEGFTHEELRQWLAAQTTQENMVAETTHPPTASKETPTSVNPKARARLSHQRGLLGTLRPDQEEQPKKSDFIPVAATSEQRWDYQHLLLFASASLLGCVLLAYVCVAIKKFRPSWLFSILDQMESSPEVLARAVDFNVQNLPSSSRLNEVLQNLRLIEDQNRSTSSVSSIDESSERSNLLNNYDSYEEGGDDDGLRLYQERKEWEEETEDVDEENAFDDMEQRIRNPTGGTSASPDVRNQEEAKEKDAEIYVDVEQGIPNPPGGSVTRAGNKEKAASCAEDAEVCVDIVQGIHTSSDRTISLTICEQGRILSDNDTDSRLFSYRKWESSGNRYRSWFTRLADIIETCEESAFIKPKNRDSPAEEFEDEKAAKRNGDTVSTQSTTPGIGEDFDQYHTGNKRSGLFSSDAEDTTSLTGGNYGNVKATENVDINDEVDNGDEISMGVFPGSPNSPVEEDINQDTDEDEMLVGMFPGSSNSHQDIPAEEDIDRDGVTDRRPCNTGNSEREMAKFVSVESNSNNEINQRSSLQDLLMTTTKKIEWVPKPFDLGCVFYFERLPPHHALDTFAHCFVATLAPLFQSSGWQQRIRLNEKNQNALRPVQRSNMAVVPVHTAENVILDELRILFMFLQQFWRNRTPFSPQHIKKAFLRLLYLMTKYFKREHTKLVPATAQMHGSLQNLPLQDEVSTMELQAAHVRTTSH